MRSQSQVSLYITMLALLLFVAHGKSCRNKYQLTKVIKTQLGRSQHFQSVKNQQDWWEWTSGTMLTELYKNTWSNGASSGSKGQSELDGNILIGEPILKKTEAFINSPHQEMYSKFEESDITSNCQKLLRKHDRTWKTVGLGPTWSVAEATLAHLKASDWLDQRTRAVAAQFTLHHPASGLFSTVTQLAELRSSGGLRLSTGVESTRLLLSAGALDWARVTAELLLFTTVMAQLIFQIWVICQNGLLPYCAHLRNWLEGSIIVTSLMYYVCLAYHFTLKSEIIDQMLREDFRVFVDVENITYWEELTVSLHGVVLFFFSLKSLFVLGMNKTMFFPLQSLRTLLSNLTWPVMAAVILILALSSMGKLLFHCSSHTFSSPLRSVRTVLAFSVRCRRMSTWCEFKSSSCIYGLLLLGILIFFINLAWTAVLKGMVTSLVRMTKRTTRKKQLFTICELGHYIKNKVFAFVGTKTDSREDHHFVNSFCLEEFEDLVDELLFKLSAFSNSLHHNLPNKETGFESPMSSQSRWSCNSESDVSLQDHSHTEGFIRTSRGFIRTPIT